MLELDGSHGEGGGQIVRTALALSSLTGTPFKITNIRKGRDKPGLKPQHLMCIKALQKLCGAVSEGNEQGSLDLTFYPKQIKGGNFELDIGTAGSITLVMQAVLLPALFADKPSRLTIIGGTDTDFAMPMDYFTEVLLPHLKLWCQKLEVKILRRGYNPAGQGKVEIFIKPMIKRSTFQTFDAFAEEVRSKIKPFKLSAQGKLQLIRGVSHASKSLEEAKVAERQSHAAQQALSKATEVRIRSEYSDSASPGSGITVWAIYSKLNGEVEYEEPIRLGADGLGKRGLPAESVGRSAAERLLKSMDSRAPVDSKLADNLIPFLALVGGELLLEEFSNHTLTNIDVVKEFLGTEFDIDKNLRTIKTKQRA